MPGDDVATAATLSPRPIACSALKACGLTLTAAPISPKAAAASKTSACIPKVLSACAAASPASPPPTIAIVHLDDISSLRALAGTNPSYDRSSIAEPCSSGRSVAPSCSLWSMLVMGLLLRPRCVHDQRGQPDVEREYFMMDFLHAKWWLIALQTIVATAAPAHAQTFPSKTIRIIVPYPPGGSIDLTARVIAKNLQHSVGQSVIVENKPGGNAAIGI